MSTFDVLLVGGPFTAAMDGPPGPITAADHLRRDMSLNSKFNQISR